MLFAPGSPKQLVEMFNQIDAQTAVAELTHWRPKGW